MIAGLKHARTGDTLVAYTGGNPKNGLPAPLNSLQLRPIVVPPPVFFVSVEPNGFSEAKHLEEVLGILLREDPSLYLGEDPESGQTHLSGMGELHLEIARDKLLHDFKANATIGPIEIGYRETVLGPSESCTDVVQREIAGKQTHASCTAMVAPLDTLIPTPADSEAEFSVVQVDGNTLTIHHRGINTTGELTVDGLSLPPPLTLPDIVRAFRTGTSAALSRGASFKFPVTSTHIEITLDLATQVFSDTTPAGLSTAARLAVRSALKSAAQRVGGAIMEPVMSVTISVDEASLGAVMHDLSASRGGQVLSLETNNADAQPAGSSDSDGGLIVDPHKVYAPPDPFASSAAATLDKTATARAGGRHRQIQARVPLKEMVGYLKHLRSLTEGRGTFVMTVDSFERMSAQRQKQLLQAMSVRY